MAIKTGMDGASRAPIVKAPAPKPEPKAPAPKPEPKAPAPKPEPQADSKPVVKVNRAEEPAATLKLSTKAEKVEEQKPDLK